MASVRYEPEQEPLKECEPSSSDMNEAHETELNICGGSGNHPMNSTADSSNSDFKSSQSASDPITDRTAKGISNNSEESSIAVIDAATCDLPLGRQEETTETIQADSGIAPTSLDPDELPSEFSVKDIEFAFLDKDTVCCGLCGEVVPFDLVLSRHVTAKHKLLATPENESEMAELRRDLEDTREALFGVKAPSSVHCKDNPSTKRKAQTIANIASVAHSYSRKVSSIRVNINEMSVPQLERALQHKVKEKLTRSVPVTLVDKLHAQCGLCKAIVSLNQKFEVCHIVRHFNAWHPHKHACSGKWLLQVEESRQPMFAKLDGFRPPLSSSDFTVVESSVDKMCLLTEMIDTPTATNSRIDASIGALFCLQCIWCGSYVHIENMAAHYEQLHSDQVEVPSCNLCVQEMVLNVIVTEQLAPELTPLIVRVPQDNHIVLSGRVNASYKSMSELIGELHRLVLDGNDDNMDVYHAVNNDSAPSTSVEMPAAAVNSRMKYGKRKKQKRQFVSPALRQAAPVHSAFVEPISDCHWKCKLCGHDILAAVISSGAIRHFRKSHAERLDSLQMHLASTRLEKISDGCMEIVSPNESECLLCQIRVPLHRAYNLCRTIRHLRSKHASLMPEFVPGEGEHEEGQGHPVLAPPNKRRKQSAAAVNRIQHTQGMVQGQSVTMNTAGNPDRGTTQQVHYQVESSAVVSPLVHSPHHYSHAQCSQLKSGLVTDMDGNQYLIAQSTATTGSGI